MDVENKTDNMPVRGRAESNRKYVPVRVEDNYKILTHSCLSLPALAREREAVLYSAGSDGRLRERLIMKAE